MPTTALALPVSEELISKTFFKLNQIDVKHGKYFSNMILPDELLGVLGVNGGG